MGTLILVLNPRTHRLADKHMIELGDRSSVSKGAARSSAMFCRGEWRPNAVASRAECGDTVDAVISSPSAEPRR